jgi:hypothetical protein
MQLFFAKEKMEKYWYMPEVFYKEPSYPAMLRIMPLKIK